MVLWDEVNPDVPYSPSLIERVRAIPRRVRVWQYKKQLRQIQYVQPTNSSGALGQMARACKRVWTTILAIYARVMRYNEGSKQTGVVRRRGKSQSAWESLNQLSHKFEKFDFKYNPPKL